MTKSYLKYIILPILLPVVGRLFTSQNLGIINKDIIQMLIELFILGLSLDFIIWLYVKIIMNPIILIPYSTEENICNIKVRNKSKIKNLEDCWCKAEKIFYFDDTGIPKDITKGKENLKFLWEELNKEKFNISYNDEGILNIAKIKLEKKPFIDILFSGGHDSFELWKNKSGKYYGKVRIKFKVFGKRENGIVYSRSVSQNIVLKAYDDEIDGKSIDVLDLRFEDVNWVLDKQTKTRRLV